MVLTHHLQSCRSQMILWLWFCSKYSKKSAHALCLLIKRHFSTVVLGAELDFRSSSLSQWMIKQRDWGNSCGGGLGISLPLNAAGSASRRKDKKETKAARIGAVERWRNSPVTQRSLSEQTSTSPLNAEKLTYTFTSCWFPLTVSINKLRKHQCSYSLRWIIDSNIRSRCTC